MPDEFDHNPENNNYSSFWPLLIIVGGLLLWFAFQDFELNSQRATLNQQFQAALPTINDAQTIGTRYVNLMKDLIQTSQKDPAAAQIVQDAIRANLIHVNQGANTNSTPVGANPPAK